MSTGNAVALVVLIVSAVGIVVVLQWSVAKRLPAMTAPETWDDRHPASCPCCGHPLQHNLWMPHQLECSECDLTTPCRSTDHREV